jgi:putative phage essential recombination function protein
MLNEKIIKIKNKFYETATKKSGKNSFQGFEYFELKDFLPDLVKLMAEEEVNDIFTIKDEYAVLKLIHKEETNEYTIPFVMFDVPLNKQGKDSMQKIQYLGALSTYYKRYLYMNAFSITENDKIDAMNNDELNTAPESSKNKTEKKSQKKYTEKEIREKSIEIISKYEEFFKKEVNDLTEKGAFQLEDVPTDNLKKLATFMKDKIKNDKDLQEVIRKKGA